ncbi:DUF4118 domain-containing protein [Georgenia sp. SYP-B2076]|uniref:DUF4118 domain-containing protein n=1 Tax=Georgenia sp. SYP-B2076 TaxID=2495881 RepID=UPI001F0CB499|nr:DUF4118 domain-containing protein [Georgenia sp. SYP-B2076]
MGTAERVVVAVSGGPESERLIRRGARMAQRERGGGLLAVHVLTGGSSAGAPPAPLATQRRLVEELGGTFHAVLGEDVAPAVAEFAIGVGATTIVVGRPRGGRVTRVLRAATGSAIAGLAPGIDVHLVGDGAATGRQRGGRRPMLSRRRTALAWALAVLGPAALTGALHRPHASIGLPTEVLLFLALTVAVALVGGLAPAVIGALIGFLTLNYFFTPPTGRLIIADTENVLALAVFLLVAVAVASVVDLAARRSGQAFRARAEAAALAEVSRSVLTGEDTAVALVARLRETFALTAVSLLERAAPAGPWRSLAEDGAGPAGGPGDADTVVRIDDDRVLALRGRVLAAGDRRVLEAFASQAGIMLENRRLREQAEQAQALERAEATRTALLAAVSHDLRTPLATIRAAIDGLLSPEVHLSAADTDALVATVGASTARLERLIDNLLDLSRLQTGSVRPVLRATSLDEVVPLATEGFGPDVVAVDVPESLPLVSTDPGLLERAMANIVANAVRHTPPGAKVRVTASATHRQVELRVVDTGPGLTDDLKAHMFEPFQRLGDSSPDGLGLGLAVTEGLASAVGAGLAAEDTPGGGLTMVLTIPLAEKVAT